MRRKGGSKKKFIKKGSRISKRTAKKIHPLNNPGRGGYRL